MNTKIEDFIGVFDNAFPKDYCEHIIDVFEKADSAGFTTTRQVHENGVSKLLKDDSHVFTEYPLEHISAIDFFTNTLWEKIYPEYAAKFNVLKESGKHSNYVFKIQRTEIGQGYHTWHYESCDRNVSNRLLAWMLYLNDVPEGGETEFLYYPKRVKPQCGTFLLWPASFTHTHRGNPPISNTKYVVTGWIEF